VTASAHKPYEFIEIRQIEACIDFIQKLSTEAAGASD